MLVSCAQLCYSFCPPFYPTGPFWPEMLMVRKYTTFFSNIFPFGNLSTVGQTEDIFARPLQISKIGNSYLHWQCNFTVGTTTTKNKQCRCKKCIQYLLIHKAIGVTCVSYFVISVFHLFFSLLKTH